MKETKINISAFRVREASLFMSGGTSGSAFHVHRERARAALGFRPCPVAASFPALLPPLQPSALWRQSLLCREEENYGVINMDSLRNAQFLTGKLTFQETLAGVGSSVVDLILCILVIFLL